jgi:hypothetical protein
MQRQKLIVGLIFGMACLLGAQQASAGSSCITRSRCTSLSARYVARAHVSCFIVVPVPMCIDRGSSCGTASASCDWYACPTGGGQARATNSAAGCFATSARAGLGLAGDASFEAAGDPTDLMSGDGGGESETLTNAHFDEATRTVEIRLESGRLAATPGGLGQRLTAWVFRDEASADEDPTPTADNTLWTGSVTLLGGRLAVAGFDPAAFALSTDDLGRTVATFADLETAVVLDDLAADDFASLAVKILTDEVAP